MWVPRGGEREPVSVAREMGQPCVLVVDYAETRGDGLAGLVTDAVADWDGPDLRVVLLARSAGERWQHLINAADRRAGDLLAAVEPVALGPVTGVANQQEVFDQAVTAFADMLGSGCREVGFVLEDPAPVVLVIHAAALLAVLDYSAGVSTCPPRSGSEALGGVLRHEERYWARSAAACGLRLQDSGLRLAVAVGCLIGAGSESAAADLVRDVPDLADSAELRGRVARWLHDLYPIGHAGREAQEWIGPLRPDPVAEHLVAGELARRPDLIPALFTSLSDSRAAKALTVLARAALTHRESVAQLRAALAADFERLAVPALSVAAETNPALGELINDVISAQPVSSALLEQIAEAIPFPSVALASAAVTVFERLADAAADHGQRAGRLVSLSNHLSALGRREEALAAVEEAVTIRRELAQARPRIFLHRLAASLDNLAARLSALGRNVEAEQAREEATRIRERP